MTQKVELVTVKEFMLEGLELLNESIGEDRKLEIDLDQLDARKLLALCVCLTGYSLDQFTNHENARKLLDDCLDILARVEK